MSERFTYLMARWLDGSSSKEEQRELWGLSLEAANQELLKAELERTWSGVTDEQSMSAGKIEALFEKVGSDAAERMDAEPPAEALIGRKWLFGRWILGSTAAAAVVMLVIGTLIWRTRSSVEQPVPSVVQNMTHEILPGGNKAVLTLSDGKKIVLDSAADGTLTKQGSVHIIKLGDGRLAYEGKDNVNALNTLSTPYGGMYRLRLPDGTEVWLNAASSITYPTAFAGPKREVHVKGEAYFEVAKDASKPFFVEVDGHSTIEVMGTDFNVNAYENEDVISTTLLQGVVKVTAGGTGDKGHQVTLKPGQQTLIDTDARRIRSVNYVDTERIVAWKNGAFNFEGIPLERAMRQLARWYDLQITYEQPVRAIQFGGTLKRNLPLSDVLHFLEGAGLHYKLEENHRLVILK
ncbi:FecR domain-containing protein [Flavitalea sp. BT771]|uniref:FecR family protein n=1 Tax=Flavitalea sp. BT771 TaxID=3063329 RepID=UPI0026E470C1|nr:FecR family protein [Flavitalea sp. BT771]MDO6430003.1 FecR domain-containing protein [Flavitalea sp. BT771]MDV6217870.1 FecR domain-containing protein [Flavitalea sp. BT771]